MGHAMNAKMDLHRSLRECRTCGGRKGFVHLAGQDRPVKVSCRCESGRCPRCSRPLVLAPSPALPDDLGGMGHDAGMLRVQCAACGPTFAHWN